MSGGYEWPEALFPLRDWMKRKGVDVEALKTERQAFWMARQLGKQNTSFTNDRTKSLFPYLLKLQKSLCPNERGGSKPTRREPYIPGTFGPASEVRHIDPAEYSKPDVARVTGIAPSTLRPDVFGEAAA